MPKTNGATATNVTVQTEELERLQQAITRKLAALPPGWQQVLAKRTAAGEVNVQVLY